ncbi:CBS domain-containing protein [Collinsella sp. zg1085]|uniref:magnesium transporter n=1 Tax=Collinsella sp. zg1085 TaxID=2844380 RepID=UPI001C0D1807|nr:CBS domain-containing protein [Collinsella sp. zg1085]QWT17789.1 CBS domain-containing protein [Collinsella sp. zg1085]
MNYFSELLGIAVIDSTDESIGVVNDLGIATGELFPHVTSLAFQGPGKTPFMISWRKYVDHVSDEGVYLNCPATDIRFSYLQPDEVLLARDILNKQIVDTQGLKVVRVNDIKMSSSGENQLRLLGAEVGPRGLLRALHPMLERVVARVAKALRHPLNDELIAWSYMDLLERSTKQIKLSVSHKTLGELHPADVADIIEKLDPRLRGQVFNQLDVAQAAEAISEFDDDELRSEMFEGLSDKEASSLLALMDPDDAAELLDELDYAKAEKLLRLMGVQEEKAIRTLLGYAEDTAGRIMTSEFVALPATDTVADAIEAIRQLDDDFESVYYVYTTDPGGGITGVLTLKTLLIAEHTERLRDLSYKDVVWVSPDVDQEEVAEEMAKYDLAAIPVCDEDRHILGIVTVDDAMDVMIEEHAEDLQIAGVVAGDNTTGETSHAITWFAQRQYWLVVWAVASAGIASVLMAAYPSELLFIYPMTFMPVCLLGAMRMVSFVKNYFLEYDQRDDEPRPYVSFFVQNTLMGLALAGIIYLCGELVASAAFHQATSLAAQAFRWSCLVAAGVTALSFMSSVIYLRVLFWRDEHDKNTTGTALSATATFSATLAYSILSSCAIVALISNM